jgi:redox-sensing transcriptional repressor
MKSGNIPEPTVRRLSFYLRELEILWRGEHRTVASRRLAHALKLTATQIRKDLAHFGQFGRRGVGYDIGELIGEIRRILGTDRTWNVLLVGAGNLGAALSAYRGFAKKGFRLVAVFDVDKSKIGRPVSPALADLKVQPLEEMARTVRTRDIRLAILAVPGDAAQEVADILVSAGIRGLLNFAPVSLDVDSKVALASVDLAVHLEQLSFQVGSAV